MDYKMDYIINLMDNCIKRQDDSMFFDKFETYEEYLKDDDYIEFMEISVINSKFEIFSFMIEKIIEKEIFTIELLKSIIYLLDEYVYHENFSKILIDLMKKVIEIF
jgi:hypothetical protein